MKAEEIKSALTSLSDENSRLQLTRFFKTQKGEYAENDCFIGVRMPIIRGLAKKTGIPSLNEIEILLNDKIHECRQIALIYLIQRFGKEEQSQTETYNFYLSHLDAVNNWDLVDLSAPTIVGEYLLTHPREILDELSASDNLWRKRIAIVSTLQLIRHGEYEETLLIAEKLLDEKHDLLQKAVGWMLREVGKQDINTELKFICTHYTRISRTTLRYAIERFDEGLRKKILQGEI